MFADVLMLLFSQSLFNFILRIGSHFWNNNSFSINTSSGFAYYLDLQAEGVHHLNNYIHDRQTANIKTIKRSNIASKLYNVKVDHIQKRHHVKTTHMYIHPSP